MAARRGRRSAARRRRTARIKTALAGGALLLGLMLVFWSAIWLYLIVISAVLGVGALGVWLWRTDRTIRRQDRRWREGDRISAGRRTLIEVDAMAGDDFEEFVADLCRRDGCTDIRRVGRTGDHGVDITGRLPDGRRMIIQCKRYAPKSVIAEREMRDLLGAKTHSSAAVALFVTTTRFSAPSLRYAAQNGLIAIHRDHLGLWNNGATLDSLLSVNGAGQGDAKHRSRWKKTYGS